MHCKQMKKLGNYQNKSLYPEQVVHLYNGTCPNQTSFIPAALGILDKWKYTLTYRVHPR